MLSKYTIKILHDINKINKNKLYTLSGYTATRGHTLELFKTDNPCQQFQQ